MKIRTQLLVTAALFVVVLLVIGASVVATTAELDRLETQARLADHVGLAANDLNYLAGEYLLYGDPQQLARWAARDAELGADLANLSAGNQQRQALIAAIIADRERLDSVFHDVEERRNETGAPFDPTFLQTAWSRVGVQTQALAFDAGLLSALLVAEADAAQSANAVEMTTLLGAFAVFALVGVFVVGRRTLASVTALQAGADIVGSGALGYTIPVTENNEVGDLARSFNRMSADLAAVTASKADLEREVERRARAEEELRESEAKYRNLVELAPDAILIHQDGAIVFANQAAAALLGAAGPEALVGRDVASIIEPGSRAHVAANVVADLRGEESPTTTIDLLRDDGTTVAGRGRGALIPFRGRTAIQVVLRDVSAEVQAEAALRESEAKYHALFLNDLTGDFIADIDGRILDCNPSFARIFGFASVEEALSASIVETYPVPEARKVLLDRIRSEGGVEFDERFRRRRDGSEIHVLENVIGIFDAEGTLVRTQGYIVDDTQRYHAVEALREYAANLRRSNEDLERFAYVSSHDLQEPLRSIVSFSQLLERRYKGKLDADADDYIEFIVEGGNRMQTLILDLLAYSRVNTKAQEPRPTDVEAVMASVERSLDLQLREAGAALSYDPLPVVLADPLQLEQVFTNLVSNAVKFRRPGEPSRIHVGVERLDGFWEFSVADNGIGIEKEYFDRIFVIFQRLHTKDAYPGTGIGLAIVKRIVDRHGGSVRVESTPGKGTTFFFTLPAA